MNSTAGLLLVDEFILIASCLLNIIVLVKAPSIGERRLSITLRNVKKVPHSVALWFKTYMILSRSFFNDSTKLNVKWSDILLISSKKVLTISFSIFNYPNSA